MSVIDIHEHIRTRDHFLRPEGRALTTADELVDIMDRLGIDKMVVLPLSSPETFEMVQSPEEVFEACDRHPGRFIKFCNVDPRIGNNQLDYDFEPILEHYKSLGAKGLGEFTSNLWWEDPRVQNLLRGCEQVGFPVIFHVATHEFGTYGLITNAGLGGLENALKRFPKLQLLGHSQAFWSEVGPVSPEKRGGYPRGKVLPGGRVPELFRAYDNLWGDLSAGSGCNAVSRDPEWGYAFIEEFQDRLLMGNDFCVPSNAETSKLIDFLNDAVANDSISRGAYEKIMGGNALKLLDLNE